MARLDVTKPEIAAITAKIYVTEMEEKVVDMWLKEMTIEEMAEELITSQSTISRKKAKIIKKIAKAL